jgi:enoyl-CoA hydratase
MTASNEGSVDLSIQDGVAALVINRPQARNAMTWAMYEQLRAICERLANEPGVRVATMRGAGGEAFVAGTDIEQFKAFREGAAGGEDGVAYERRIDQGIALIEQLPMPTVAIVEGWCVGGGLAMATACDFRIATPKARFGVPIAKTLGNCLSIPNLARLQAVFGAPRVKRMLLLAELLGSEEALACGFVLQVCAPEEIEVAAQALCARLAALAPVTQRVVKEGLRRIVAHELPEGDDLVQAAYGSRDFREGVEAFVGKRSPVWGQDES